jgi:hypothetical protein
MVLNPIHIKKLKPSLKLSVHTGLSFLYFYELKLIECSLIPFSKNENKFLNEIRKTIFFKKNIYNFIHFYTSDSFKTKILFSFYRSYLQRFIIFI